ncbi:MAG: Mur ligase domain-containing protein [Tepidisphaeraceae bacterium]
MRLDELLRLSDLGYRSDAPPDLDIAGVADDSRAMKPGDLFVARPGPADDGGKYALDAVAKGASAVVAQTPIDGLSVPLIVVRDAALAVAKLAEAFCGAEPGAASARRHRHQRQDDHRLPASSFAEGRQHPMRPDRHRRNR